MSLPVLQAERLTLRPVTDADLDGLAAIIRSRACRVVGESGEAERLREDLRMDGDAWAIEVDGELAGWLGFTEETEPEYPRSASTSASRALPRPGPRTGRAPHGDPLARDERGHHRFTIDPAATTSARSRPTRVGFKPVGMLRRYERDPDGQGFHDGLLMDLLIDELR